ncbi:MAG TPA: deoxyribodipyrimidine photo-lyase [Burkholderiales bacterium]|jgi:deoxyribodipyrimidine photo-lyase
MRDADEIKVRYPKALFWFRRDLRVADNAGLYRALKAGGQVWCVFVFDTEILDPLAKPYDRRVEFILESLKPLRAALHAAGGGLIVRHGRAREEIPALARSLEVNAVFTNEDYEPQAIARDGQVRHDLGQIGIAFHAVKDLVIFAKDEILTQADKPFSVFTPYKNAWLKKLDNFTLRAYPSEHYLDHLAKPVHAGEMPTLDALGFAATNLHELQIPPGSEGAGAMFDEFLDHIGRYREARDFPAVRGCSYLSVHNRFGTISIRALARAAHERRSSGADTWLSELIWRDFYFQILYHFPESAQLCFKPEYEGLKWRNNEDEFTAWCEARTGYPIVDAAMRQINSSGYMHNRLRMIAASFLTKDLLIDWRWGERYFAVQLNDYDLAANAGSWQWAASTGCDAQPYFRIFNPVTQSERFDPQGKFIRRYLPELAKVPDAYIHAPWTMPPLEQQAAGCVIGRDYPEPMVDHAGARERALDAFKAIRAQG